MRETRETNEAQHASLCASALRALLLRNWTYLQAVAIDANLHQQATYTDALWRVAYTQELSGASQQAFGSGITSYAVTTNQYDPTGALRQITDPQGHVTTITDDALGRQIALQDPNRGAETASYDPNGNVTQTADARGGAGTINAGYDGLNRQLWRNTTPSASGAYVTYGYDSVAGGNQGKGRLTSESFTGGLGNSLSGSYASTYDSRGRLTQQSQTTGNLTNCPTGWTCVGVSNPTVKGNQFYSSDGVWTVQAAGHGIGTTSDSFQYNYQSLPGDGVLSAQVTSQTVTNAYAKSGIMLRATTDPGSPFYDVVVRPQGVQVQYRATSGAASVAAATVSTANVPIYLQITRSGTTFSAATSPDGVTWTPIANSTIAIGALTGTLLEGLAATSNDLNRLGASTFAHVSLSATAPAASTNSTHYTYNDDDQLASETYPNGDVVTTTYSAATGAESGLNLTPSGSSTATGLLSGVTYSGQAGAAGLVTGATLGAITTGTATFNASYDGLLRLTDKQYRYTPSGGSASTLYETQPSYDAVDNVVGVTTTLPQGTDHQAFCYDEQNRLTWAGATGTPPCGASLSAGTLTAAQYSASYSYDTLNRLTSSPLGSYSYGDSAHLDAATSIGPSGGAATWTGSYDAAGNTSCRAATSATTCAGATPNGALLTWDNEGRLTAWQNIENVTTSPASIPALEEALYDGEGQRVQQVDESNATNTTTQHTYVGGLEDIASQWPNAGGATTTTTTAYYGGGLAESVNGTLSYTLGDSLGSVSESVNTSGTVTVAQLYSPYGNVRYSSGTLPTDYAFTHQRADATSGLDDYGARFYDPVAGQFTSADTTLAGGLNRYAYVGGNPETFVDPTGHVEVESGTEVNGLPDVGPTGTGIPNINLGPILVGIGAALTGLIGGVWALFHPAPVPSSAAVVAARQQSNAMAAWNASVPSSADVRHQSNALDAAEVARSGGGSTGGGGVGGSGMSGGGTGTVPRLPPPTEDGEAIGLGAPLLSDEVLAECDPQLPTAQYCIGWTRAWASEYVDLASPQRREHILSGDATGGGHRPGTGITGKSEFPAEWSDDEIMHVISDVATDPRSIISAGRWGRTNVNGTRIVAETGQRIDIQVVLGAPNENEPIVTAFPTNLPKNP